MRNFDYTVIALTMEGQAVTGRITHHTTVSKVTAITVLGIVIPLEAHLP